MKLLNSVCREHDIVYLKSNNLDNRLKADKILENCDLERVNLGSIEKKLLHML